MNSTDSLYSELEAFIEDNFYSSTRSPCRQIYVKMGPIRGKCYQLGSLKPPQSAVLLKEPNLSPDKISHWIEEKAQAPFKEVLFSHIDTKYSGNDSEVYKKAGIDRKLFSKIRTSESYIPNKTNVIALMMALELDEDEAEAFMSAAGYSLSYSRRFDLIIRFCIKNRIYDLMIVNELLYHMGLKTVY
jgi:hypothetical protein